MNYEELCELIPSISLACLYHSYGKLDKLLWCGIDEPCEDFYAIFYDLLCVTADFVCSDYNEDYDQEKWYFSFKSMMQYYTLCRQYSSRHGLKLTENPYMLQARGAVIDIFDHTLGQAFGYGYTLHTRIGHEWASGIALQTDCYFDGHYELLEAMLELDDWYTDGVIRLKRELECGVVIPFPAVQKRKEAA